MNIRYPIYEGVYRILTGEIVCVRCSFRNTESFKIMEDLIRECVSIFA